jgi:pimeloyl-ACP methyl ester carboxylesterase
MGHALRFTTNDGLTLAGQVDGAGTGPLVVLLHGGGQTRHAWAETAARLAGEGFDVARYDARGHGDSDWAPDRDYRMATHAHDLIGVLRALDRPAGLVGASMGGVAALMATASEPALVWALVLVDIVPRFAAAGVERIRTFMTAHPDGFATLEEAATAVRAYNPLRRPSKNPQGLLRSLRERNGRLHWHWDPAVIGASPDETLADMLSERLAALPPTLRLLLVAGAQSDVVDDEAIATFRRQAPQAETVAVAQAGHMVAGDRNDAFGEVISGFLKRSTRPDEGTPAPPRRRSSSGRYGLS